MERDPVGTLDNKDIWHLHAAMLEALDSGMTKGMEAYRALLSLACSGFRENIWDNMSRASVADRLQFTGPV